MFTINITKHQCSKTCKILQQRRKNKILQNKQVEASNIKFYVYNTKLERKQEFKYLGRILNQNDNNDIYITIQIEKARQRWNCVAKILKREGANAKTIAKFYLTIVQAVLLYGADSWTITTKTLQQFQSFYNRALRYMTGKHI